MKNWKKVLSLVLVILMLSTMMLTSCNNSNQNPFAEEVRSPITIVMAVVSEKEVSAETEKLVEDAVNAITTAQYKTKIDLRYYTPDGYFQKMVDLVNAAMNYKEEAPVTSNKDGETTPVEEETKIDEEYGYAVTIYPEVRESQLDILFVEGVDMYRYFVEQGYLARLEECLAADSKLISDYVLGDYLKAVKYNQGTYAVPNNVVANEYTYLLVNKELAQKYQYTETMKTWKNIIDTEAFAADIAKFETGIVPIYGKVVPTNVHNWSYDISTLGKYTELVENEVVDDEGNTKKEEVEEVRDLVVYKPVTNRFSIFGSIIPTDTVGDQAILGLSKQLVASSSYTTQLIGIQKLKDNNYIKETIADGEKFAVGFIKGNESDVAKYRDEYEIVITEYPTITQNEVYAGMFGVCEYTRYDEKRSMEIITHLNTKSDLRDILQYGIKGVHYEISEKTGVLTRLNQDYMMDINKTGNVFIAHAEEGILPEVMDVYRAQNRDAILYPGISFSSNAIDGVFADYVEQANTISAKYQAKLDACKTAAEIEAVVAEFAADTEIDTLFRQWNNTSPADDNYSPYALYYNWLVENGLVVEEDEEGN